MYIVATVIPVLLASFATSKSLSFFGHSQTVLNDKLDVPGENPLQFCQNTSNYSLIIQNVNLTPNPPKP